MTRKVGHVLKREGENNCFTALGWTPEGRRARGRPRDHLEKDCGEGEKQGKVEELECSQRGGMEQRVLVREHGDVIGTYWHAQTG